MQTVRLGRTGLSVTKIGMGGIPLQRVGEEEAIRMIRGGFELGIDWFDTANGYGVSEERFGKAVKGYDRGRLKVFTKGGATTPDELTAQVELSLRRLDIEEIDLYQFHNVSPASWSVMAENGTIERARKLKASGRIRHLGFSAHVLESALAGLDHPDMEVIQWPFNALAEEGGLAVLAKCRQKDAGLIAMKPLGGGVLNAARPCLRYLQQFPDVVADPGFEHQDELEEAVRIIEDREPFSEADARSIEALKAEMGSLYCRRCGYCAPCPQGVSIVMLMSINSLLRRFPRDAPARNGWAQSIQTVESCIECGKCETKCPYKLPIRKRIREGAALFHKLAG